MMKAKRKTKPKTPEHQNLIPDTSKPLALPMPTRQAVIVRLFGHSWDGSTSEFIGSMRLPIPADDKGACIFRTVTAQISNDPEKA